MNIQRSGRITKILSGLVYWVVMSFIYSSLLASILGSHDLQIFQIITDTAITNILLTGGCYLIINNMRFYLPRQEKYWYVLTLSLAEAAIIYYLAKGILWLIFHNDPVYMKAFNDTSGIRFGILFLVIGCFSTLSLLQFTQAEQQSVDKRKDEMERLAREAELFRLRQQLQPHFLFNSLNSISALTGSQPEKARHMIEQLSDFLRGTIKTDNQQWNSLKEELQYLRLYLEIEKVRFGHRLQTDIVSDDAALQLRIPALLLQPVVENAIKFGLYDTTGAVLITISAVKDGNDLQIEVSNPFDAETSQPMKGTGFGLTSIERRLYLLFARHDLLTTHKQDEQFTTRIKIPQAV